LKPATSRRGRRSPLTLPASADSSRFRTPAPPISGESLTEGSSNIKREPARGNERRVSVVDPLGDSYEKRIFAILKEVEELGGTIKLIEKGWFQKHIADFAYETALRRQSGEKPVLGVNRYPIAQRVATVHLSLDPGGRRARRSHGQASPLHSSL
jgi:hypothetical protein